MTESARQHARLGGSTADRWINCPGSPGFIERLLSTAAAMLPPPSSYALAGTCCHTAVEIILKTGKEPDWDKLTYKVWENGSTIEKTLDAEEIEAVHFCVAVLREDLAKYGGEILIEQPFSLEKIRPDMWGTNDAILIRCADGVLRVYDWKFGRGVVVDVTENTQLKFYGLGALMTLQKLAAKEIELIIVQPRTPDPVRRWRYDLLDAYDFRHELKRAGDRTDDPQAPLVAGTWCKWCPAAGVCKVHDAWRQQQSGLVFASLLPDPRAFTLEEIAERYPKVEIMEDWIRLFYECAHAAAQNGRKIRGYKLVAKRGIRKWISEEIVRALVALGLKQADLFNVELKSPAQMEKLLPKDRRDELKPLYQMVSSGTSLVPESDPRREIAAPGFEAFPMLPPGEATQATSQLPPSLR